MNFALQAVNPTEIMVTIRKRESASRLLSRNERISGLQPRRKLKHLVRRLRERLAEGALEIGYSLFG